MVIGHDIMLHLAGAQKSVISLYGKNFVTAFYDVTSSLLSNSYTDHGGIEG